MNMEVSASIAAYVVFAVVSSVVIGFTLLSYEPQNRDLWQFLVAVGVFLLIAIVFWPYPFAPLLDDSWSLGSVGWQGAVLAVGGIIGYLTGLGLVLITARQWLS